MQICRLGPTAPHVELAVEVFALLADATRVRLILALGDGELTVNALAGKVGKPAAAVSQHLAKMRLCGMVATRQEGTRPYYRLRDSRASQPRSGRNPSGGARARHGE